MTNEWTTQELVAQDERRMPESALCAGQFAAAIDFLAASGVHRGELTADQCALAVATVLALGDMFAPRKRPGVDVLRAINRAKAVMPKGFWCDPVPVEAAIFRAVQNLVHLKTAKVG